MGHLNNRIPILLIKINATFKAFECINKIHFLVCLVLIQFEKTSGHCTGQVVMVFLVISPTKCDLLGWSGGKQRQSVRQSWRREGKGKWSCKGYRKNRRGRWKSKGSRQGRSCDGCWLSPSSLLTYLTYFDIFENSLVLDLSLHSSYLQELTQYCMYVN